MQEIKRVSPQKSEKKENRMGYLFAAPGILGFLIFTAVPMVVSLYYSFNKVSVLDSPKWVGLDNYVEMLTGKSSLFLKSMSVTLIYALCNVVIVMAFSIVIAILLNRKFRGRNTLRALFFLPSVLPVVTTTILWSWILDYRSGLMNQLLNFLGIRSQNWLLDERNIFISLFMMSLWAAGGSIVVMIATLQDVPSSLLEAIDVDGGGALAKTIHVVLPMISPVVFFQTIMCLISSLQIFTQSLMLSSNGSPNRMTYFINVMVYDEAFKQLKMGSASAEAWGMFVVILALTGLLFWSKKYWVFDNGGDK